MFAGLPELGISNGEDLKETLTNCTEPLKAIDQFQVNVIDCVIGGGSCSTLHWLYEAFASCCCDLYCITVIQWMTYRRDMLMHV